MKIHILSAVISAIIGLILFFGIFMPVVHVNQETTSYMLNELHKVEEVHHDVR